MKSIIKKLLRENLENSDKNKLLGKEFYHGTVLEIWKQGYNQHLFICNDIEFAKAQANARAKSSVDDRGTPFTAIVVKITIDETIINLDWHVDDDEGGYRYLKTWQDSYNEIGCLVIQGNYNINKFPIVYKQIFK